MNKPKIHLIMPMGGRGSRFEKYRFEFPKPLIEIKGKPFFYWATQSIRKYVELESLIFVVLKEHIEQYGIDKEIRKFFPEAIIHSIPDVLNGAVLTCMEGIQEVNDNHPVIFNDCDHIFSSNQFNEFCKRGDFTEADGIVLTFKAKDPKYSFLAYDEQGNVIKTVEKEVISNDAICGAYYFRNKEIFSKAVKKYLVTCNYQEYFVSGVYNVMAEEGKTIKGYATDFHIPFGVPEEYKSAKVSERFNELL